MKVWDLPTRLFHWAIVLLIAFSWWSAETHRMEWHYRSGLAVLILLTFRIVWGFVGASTARFAHFVRSPGTVLAYLRSTGGAFAAGHNPLGGYSVIAMLLALTVQVGTGLFAVDVDGLESGPLSPKVSFEQGRLAAEVHGVSFTVLQVLIVLHLLAIAFYWMRGRRLIVPMLTGHDPQIRPGSPELTGGGVLRAVIATVAALLLGWWISMGAPMG